MQLPNSMRAWCATMLVALAAVATAGEPASVQRTVGADLILDKAGQVADVTIEEGTHPALAALVQSTVKQWRFEPILRNGEAISARVGVELDLEGTPDGNEYRMRVARVLFVNSRAKAEKFVVPRMPDEAMRVNTNIAVLAAMRVDGNGNVVDVAVLSLEFTKGKHAQLRRQMVFELKRALMMSKFRPADLALGESPEDTFYLPIDYKTSTQRMPIDKGERWRNATPVPWLDAAHQPKLLDLPESRDGLPIGLASEEVKLKTEVVGTTL